MAQEVSSTQAAPVARQAPLTITHAVIVATLLTGAALWAALGLGQGTWRIGLAVGVVAGGIGGAFGFLMLARTMHATPSAALVGRAVGFMARMVLVLGGLLVTMQVYKAEPMAFVLAFFPLFFVFTGLEHLVAMGTTGTQAPNGAVRGSH